MNRSQRWVAVAVRAAGFAAVLLLLLTATKAWAQQPRKETALRPPAVPLVVHDPYLSIWSQADRLTDATTQHWTRREHPLVSLIRIDGKSYRLMGKEPKDVPALQTGRRAGLPDPKRLRLRRWPCPRHAHLHDAGPAGRPGRAGAPADLHHLGGDARLDGAGHTVSIYDSTSALLAVNTPDQKVEWAREPMRRPDGACGLGRSIRRCSSRPATIRASTGATPMPPRRRPVQGGDRGQRGAAQELRRARERFPSRTTRACPAPPTTSSPCLAFVFDLGRSAPRPSRAT